MTMNGLFLYAISEKCLGNFGILSFDLHKKSSNSLPVRPLTGGHAYGVDSHWDIKQKSILSR
jgi:hypothetical protein